MPVINANPITIKEKLRSVISSGEMRREYAKKSRDYFEMTHSNKVVLKAMEDLYDEVRLRNTDEENKESLFTERMLTLREKVAINLAGPTKTVDEGPFLSKIKELKN